MHHRSAKFYDLRIEAKCRYKEGPKRFTAALRPRPLLKIADEIQNIYNSDGFIRQQNGVCFYLADCYLDEKNSRLLLLVNKSDSTEPDQAISNPEKRAWQVLKKPEGYGNDYSAHVLISLTPDKNDENLYPMVYETIRGSGIYGTHIKSFMNKIFSLCRTKYPHHYLAQHPAGVVDEAGEPVFVNALHTCIVNGKISDDFQKDLEAGQLDGIELINYDHQDNFWDDHSCIREARRVVELQAASTVTEKIAALTSVFKKASDQEYSQARVRFRDERGAPQNVALFTDDFSLVDDSRYVKKTRITVKRNDESGFKSIHPEIKDEIYKLL